MDGGGRSARSTWVVALALVLLTLASLPWLVQDWWDDRPDAARYLLAARSLANGEGYTVMGEPFRLRPPGFSSTLAPLVAWRGFDFLALNVFVSLFAVAAVVLLFLLLAPRIGTTLAFATALVVWVNPLLQSLANQVMSDVPALALALLALLAMRWANAAPGFARDAVVAVAIALACYFRTANLVLLPAFVAERAVRWLFADAREPAARFAARRLAAPSALFVLLYLPWALEPSYASQYDSPDLYSYTTAFLRRDPNDPTASFVDVGLLLERLERNATGYAATFASAGTTRRPSPWAPLAGAIGVGALLVTLVRRRESPEWFALGTLAVLIGYYVAAVRLLLPVMVLALGALVDTLRWLGRKIAPARAVDAVLLGALVVLGIAMLPLEVEHSRGPEHWASLRATTEHLRATVPADAPLGGDVGAVYALMLDRPVYSLRPISRRHRRKELFAMLEKTPLDAIVARREGPLAPVLAGLARSGRGELVELPEHVVLHFAPAARSETESSRDQNVGSGDSS
ncbi:MAG TPA: hypothetical protein VIS07_09875 [Candidatus Binatia bacterium]